ncbi:hypothetical protein JHK86_004648 [Glycine max]|nr:hypothetical protein JHK86_004648 [Glycine max]
MLERESARYNILLTGESLSIPIARADADANADVVTATAQDRYLPVSFNQAISATMPFFTAILAFLIACKKETGLLRNKLVSTAQKSMQRNVKLSQLYQNMKEAYDEIQTPLVPQMPTTFSKVSIIQELDATAYEEAPAIAFNMSFECHKAKTLVPESSSQPTQTGEAVVGIKEILMRLGLEAKLASMKEREEEVLWWRSKQEHTILLAKFSAKFCALRSLKTVNLSNNSLVGEIPNELQGIESLQDFQIFNNHLSGLIPSWVGNWTNLRVFAAYENNFNGRIPGTLGFISELKILNLHSNNLEGPIP